ncbi:leucine-rich repeat protein kinase family protein [Artemisia annua]|uniref:Leucine-rich repeat protein kinase family protein n=1 Tax=Artemisia annua TaxID=35608 RepID=A0A2U1L2U1_ARTAN|nr:leucine-rich repeat protein kinase family protein [Artemisia annua]
MTTIRQLYLLTALTLIVLIHARLYLDPKHHEMSHLESPNGIDNKLVSKRYNFAETNSKSNSNDIQAPPPGKRTNTVPQSLVNRSKLRNSRFLEKEDGVALLQIIGKGGCGEVYKAELPEGKKADANLIGWLDLARHKVALGVASGLEYLHLNHTPRIVQRDLKPANVLLDDDMEARIADFGLAKSIPDAHSHMTSSNVAGTLGYIAPEYHQTLKFTDKCDIYSFGVVLASLVMGKFPSDEFFQRSEFSLLKYMRNVMISEDPKQANDPKMLGNGYEDQMLLVLKIACFCTLDNPRERPDSKDIKLMLAQITHQMWNLRASNILHLASSYYSCIVFFCSAIVIMLYSFADERQQGSASILGSLRTRLAANRARKHLLRTGNVFPCGAYYRFVQVPLMRFESTLLFYNQGTRNEKNVSSQSLDGADVIGVIKKSFTSGIQL